MKNHILLPRCTVQLATGEFCDADAAEDMPFPICLHHALQVHKRMREHRSGESPIEACRVDIEQQRAAWRPSEVSAEQVAALVQARADQSVVYYMRLPGDRIKIGMTTNMTLRLINLRVRKDAVLATEPGGYDLERMRHHQFKDLRYPGSRGKQTEDFEPGQELLDHIAMIRKHFGEPRITTYPKVS